MSANTNIGWTDHSCNLWWGCVEVGPGCDRCYARIMAEKFHPEIKMWGVHEPRLIMKNAFRDLDSFQRKAAKANEVHSVFINSMSDLAEMLPDSHPQRAEIDGIRLRFFQAVESGAYPNLIFIWLTKRIGNVSKVVPDRWMKECFPINIWLLATVCNQAEADRDIPKLLEIPAIIVGLSIEPCLGDINLECVNDRPWSGGDGIDGTIWTNPLKGVEDMEDSLGGGRYELPRALGWVVVGGESGHGFRELDLEAMQSVIEQCKHYRMPVYVKQDSGLFPGKQGRIPDAYWNVKQFPVIDQ